MKATIVGNFGRSWDGSICDEEHIAKALEDIGTQVHRWQREETNQEMPRDTDFVVISQWQGYPENLVPVIRNNTNCPVIYWAFDYQESGQEWHERLVEQADLYLSKPLSDAKYPNWQWLPQDFAPTFLDKIDSTRPRSTTRDIDVLFTGSYLPWATDRIETLRAVDKMFNLVIHSFTPGEWEREGFKDVRGPVMDEGLPDLISRAKVNLAIDHTITPGYWSDRAAQIMACGGFVFHRYTSMLPLVFRNNIAYFYGIDDCLDQLQWWLSHDTERDIRAKWGYQFAHSNLMVHHRVNDLLSIVGSVL